MQDLAAQREAYAYTLTKAAENLKEAIQRAMEFDNIFGLLNFIASVAVDIAEDVSGFSELTGNTRLEAD